MTATCVQETCWSAGLRPGALEAVINIEPGRTPAFQ